MRVSLCFVLLFSVLIFSMFCHYSIRDGILDLETAVSACANSIANEAWSEAEVYLQNALAIWNKKRPFYAMVARHNLFDEVYVTMQTLPALLYNHDDSCFSQTVNLSEQLSLLRYSEAFSWENIF